MINSRRFPRVDATFPVQVREPSGRSVVGQAVRSDTDGTAFAFVNLTKPDFFRLRHQAERLYLWRQLYIMVVEDAAVQPSSSA